MGTGNRSKPQLDYEKVGKYDKIYVNDGTNITYICAVEAGRTADTDLAIWSIKKLTWDGTFPATGKYADGDTGFHKVYDDMDTYTY